MESKSSLNKDLFIAMDQFLQETSTTQKKKVLKERQELTD